MSKKDKITKFNISVQRFKGRLQSVFMSFGLTKSAIVTIITALIAISIPVLQLVLKKESNKDTTLDFIAGLGASVSALYTLFSLLYEYIKRANGTVAFIDEHDRSRLKESLRLSDSEKEGGFEILRFFNGSSDELYIESQRFNRFLQSGTAVSISEVKRKYELPDEVKPLVPAILEATFRSPNLIFNGKMIRQASCVDTSKHTVLLQKTDYFSGQCSHEIAYKQFILPGTIDVGFSGEKMLLAKDGNIFNLTKSPCANFLGASTLAFTRDKKLIIGKQANYSKANKGRFAPSGSGSADYSDLKKARKYYGKNKSGLTFNELITFTMTRELCEECNYPLKQAKTTLRTALIGYARLLERGGKPDYFGISYIDEDSENIQRNIRKTEYGLVDKIHSIAFDNYNDIPDILEDFCIKHTESKQLSVQLYLIACQLKAMRDDGILEDTLNSLTAKA